METEVGEGQLFPHRGFLMRPGGRMQSQKSIKEVDHQKNKKNKIK
jgi:hypothetical protein